MSPGMVPNNATDSKSQEKAKQTKLIDSLREDKDLIDLSHIVSNSKKVLNRRTYQDQEQSKRPEPEVLQADSEKKQQTMLTTLDHKKKELQRQKELIEQLNRELQQLDAPVSKEITMLRSKIEQIDRELAKATKIRKQKEQELLTAIDTVTRLADEKCTVSEKLKSIMYEFETAKQKKLTELEDQMRKAGV